jgi:hypothetical protein
MTKDEK